MLGNGPGQVRVAGAVDYQLAGWIRKGVPP
jgi:hypothetical protein